MAKGAKIAKKGAVAGKRKGLHAVSRAGLRALTGLFHLVCGKCSEKQGKECFREIKIA